MEFTQARERVFRTGQSPLVEVKVEIVPVEISPQWRTAPIPPLPPVTRTEKIIDPVTVADDADLRTIVEGANEFARKMADTLPRMRTDIDRMYKEAKEQVMPNGQLPLGMGTPESVYADQNALVKNYERMLLDLPQEVERCKKELFRRNVPEYIQWL